MSSSESDFSLDDSDFDDDFEEVKKKPKTLKTSTKAVKPAKSPAKNKRKADVAPPPAKAAKTSASASASKTSISIPAARTSAIAPTSSVVLTTSTNGPPVSSEAAARKLILSYMTQQNRPYSVIQVFDNLHKRVGKALVQKVLDSLSAGEGPLKCKEYGKAKIYYLDQV